MNSSQQEIDFETYSVECKYCAHIWEWTFIPNNDFQDMEDIYEYDFETSCPNCGCPVRLNECIYNLEDWSK